MSCCVCATTKDTDKIGVDQQCIEQALNSIRQHFLSYKNLLEEKEQNIELLLQRNSRLTKAVELLQRDTQCQRNAANTEAALPTTPQSEAALSPVPGDDLNIALDSEQMLRSCSVFRCSSPNECIIAETEPVNSPIKLPEKIKSASTTFNCDDQRAVLGDQSNINYIGKKQTIIKTFDSDKTGVATDSARKLRQTRLHFDFKRAAKKKRSFAAEVNKSTEKIVDSPIKQQKAKYLGANSARAYSWCRTNPRFSWEDDVEQDSHVIEKSLIPKEEEEVKAEATDLNHMQIDEGITSRSVLIMSPQPPEIVFLDDSTTDDDTTHVKTMDLLKLDATSLQRAESSFIKSAKIDKHVIETDKTKWLRPQCVKIKQETHELKCTNSKKINMLATNLSQIEKQHKEDEFLHRPVLVKRELLSPQKPQNLKNNLQDANMSSMQLTPDNFWNPFIESFRADDPRKQVLRDTRLPQHRKKL